MHDTVHDMVHDIVYSEKGKVLRNILEMFRSRKSSAALSSRLHTEHLLRHESPLFSLIFT